MEPVGGVDGRSQQFGVSVSAVPGGLSGGSYPKQR